MHQGGRCPGNQGNQEIEKSGNLTGCPNVNVLPYLGFNVMTSVSTKIPYQEVRKISLRSGNSHDMKVEKWKSGHSEA